jgi:hypothetical protein
MLQLWSRGPLSPGNKHKLEPKPKYIYTKTENEKGMATLSLPNIIIFEGFYLNLSAWRHPKHCRQSVDL